MRSDIVSFVSFAALAIGSSMLPACSDIRIEELVEDSSDTSLKLYTYSDSMWKKAQDVACFLKRTQANAALVIQIFGMQIEAHYDQPRMMYLKKSMNERKMYIISFYLDEQKRVSEVEFDEIPFPITH